MLRVCLGCLAAAAIVCGALYARGHHASLNSFVNANMLPASTTVAPTMDKCKTIDLTTNENLAAASAAKGGGITPAVVGPPALKAGTAVQDTGATAAKPFWVQNEAELADATSKGGCQCGTAVCTIGRICYEAKSMCFIPPCPTKGLESGKQKTPEIYSAGCWCSDPKNFNPLTLTIAGNSHTYSTGLTQLPFFPTAAMGDSEKAVICEPGQYCDASPFVVDGKPQCLSEAKL